MAQHGDGERGPDPDGNVGFPEYAKALDQFGGYLRVMNRAHNTVRWYLADSSRFLGYMERKRGGMPFESIGREDVRDVFRGRARAGTQEAVADEGACGDKKLLPFSCQQAPCRRPVGRRRPPHGHSQGGKAPPEGDPEGKRLPHALSDLRGERP